MDHVLNEHTDAVNAMSRDGLGSISFYWGDKKAGVAHIIDKRGVETARKMVDVISNGKVEEVYKTGRGRERRNVSLDDHSAVLALDKSGNRGTWLLTGFEIKKPLMRPVNPIARSLVLRNPYVSVVVTNWGQGPMRMQTLRNVTASQGSARISSFQNERENTRHGRGEVC